MTREPETWDQKLGRFLRSLWRSPLGPLGVRSSAEDPVDSCERATFEQWDREEAEARDSLRDRRARRNAERKA